MKKRAKYFSLHYSFIVLMVMSLFMGTTLLLLMYFMCLLIHEAVHGIVARKLGYKIGKIKLLATGAVLEAESDEFSFSDEIKIAISGPLFNLCFCLILIVFWWIVPESYNFTLDLCVINLAIFAFNMLPIFPLDGGRILLATMSKKAERKVAVRISKTITIIFSLLLFVTFIFSLFISPNFSLGMMSVTLFISGITEDKNAVYKRSFYLSRKADRTKKRGVEVRQIYVSISTPKTKLLKLLDARHFTIFVLVDDNMKPIELIKENELVEQLSSS